MNKTVFNFSIAAFAIGMSFTSLAQNTRIIRANDNMQSTKDNQPSKTNVVKGNWKVVSDGSGRMYIADNENNIVRVITGDNGSLAQKDPPVNTIINSPVGLAVDNAGDLHIIDNVRSTVPGGKLELQNPQSGGWNDPDMPEPSNIKVGTMATLKPKAH